jgi:hypothetical protein
MKDEDLEYEWRLLEISSRKRMVTSISSILVLQDIIWTLVLSEVEMTGKIIKIAIDVMVFWSLI